MNTIRIYTVGLCCLIALYLLLLLAIPPDSSVLTKYSLSPNQAKILGLTVALPMIAIWTTTLMGLRRITRYAAKIRKNKEGRGFNKLAKGIAILVMGLPVNTVLSSIVNHISREYPNFIPSGAIITNYVSLGITFTGFLFIAHGTKKLVERMKSAPVTLPPTLRVVIIILSLGFIYSVFSNPLRSVASGDQEAVYYLPDWLLATTIVAPYIFAWYIGIKGSYQLFLYSRLVSGIIYKKALRYISTGLAAVIGASILLRFVSRLSTQLQNAELQVLLAVIYLLLVAISIGYIYISIGAKKLKQIEDV